MTTRDQSEFGHISEEVGARLAERRAELKTTLRDVASRAEVSPGHLSDIEKGRTQVSLPVLLRLVRALDLSIGDLLPRIGGHHVRSGSLADLTDESVALLSHPELELGVTLVHLKTDETHVVANVGLDDMLVHVLEGSVEIRAGGVDTYLGTGDTLDSERVIECKITALDETQLLVVARKAKR